MNWPGEALINKVLDILANGVGAGLRPWTIKRDARAHALAAAETRRIDRIAQEELRRDLRDLRAGRKTIGADHKLLPAPEMKAGSATALGLVAAHYLQNIEARRLTPTQFIELERRINLEQIAAIAIEEAATDENGTADDAPIDRDWFSQWRNRAQDVSDEEMQRLWARVLTGQARVAGSFSIHTMEFLSRMSREDAELIALLGEFALNRRHIFADTNVALIAAGLNLEKLLYLQDLGILSGVGGVGNLNFLVRFGAWGRSDLAVAVCNDKGVIFRRKEANQSALQIGGYPISVVGRELLKLAQCKANMAYLREVAEAVRSQCESISVGEAVKTNDALEIQSYERI